MNGLRQRQKETRRKRVIQAAMELFLERGYDTVKLEEIAAKAEISAGIIYTYFSTKNDLLLAVLVDDFDGSFASGEAVIEVPITNACDAITQLIFCHFREVEGGVSREMWRIAIATFIRNVDSPFAREYNRCLIKMRRQYIKLNTRLHSLGHLPKSVSCDELADLIINNANMTFIEFIRDGKAPISVFFKRVNSSTRNIIQWASATKPSPQDLEPH